jgi:hypothetical protein
VTVISGDGGEGVIVIEVVVRVMVRGWWRGCDDCGDGSEDVMGG